MNGIWTHVLARCLDPKALGYASNASKGYTSSYKCLEQELRVHRSRPIVMRLSEGKVNLSIMSKLLRKTWIYYSADNVSSYQNHCVA